MTMIVISYRRADSEGISGRIFDKLVSRYGADGVFMDVDNIPLGLDFRTYIREMLDRSDILRAIVGPEWTGRTKDGRRRVDDPNDLVRIEVETALKRGIPVIPILVGGSTMPSPNELPESLSDFPMRNAADVSAGRDFHFHVDRLIRSMDLLLERRVPRAPADPRTAPAEQAATSGAPRSAARQEAVPAPPTATMPELPVEVAASAPASMRSFALRRRPGNWPRPPRRPLPIPNRRSWSTDAPALRLSRVTKQRPVSRPSPRWRRRSRSRRRILQQVRALSGPSRIRRCRNRRSNPLRLPRHRRSRRAPCSAVMSSRPTNHSPALWPPCSRSPPVHRAAGLIGRAPSRTGWAGYRASAACQSSWSR